MSTISSVGGSSTAWAVTPREGPPPRGDKLFDKLDADASGGIDATELQDFVDHVKQRSGKDLGSAEDALKTMDADGNGTLDDSELRQGLRELMPPPSSTLQFAERRMEGPPPPPPDAAGTEATQGLASALSQLLSAIDSDGDEQLSGTELQRFGEVLEQSLSETDIDTTTDSDAAGTASAARTDPAAQLAQLVQRMLAQYASTAEGGSADGGTGSVSVTA